MTTATVARRIATGTASDAIEIYSLLDILREGNDQPLIDHLNANGAGHAFRLVQHSPFTRLLLYVVRQFAGTRDGDLHAQRAFDLLAKPEVRTQVLRRIGAQQEIKEAEAAWKLCRQDARRKKISHYRDKQLAHRSEPLPGVSWPLWGETIEFSEQTADAMILLGRAFGVIVEPEHLRGQALRSSKVFWQSLTNGLPKARKRPA